jgi:hypothetical protein
MADLLDDADESLAALERSGRRRSRVVTLFIVVAVIVFLGVGAVLVAEVVYPGIGQYARGLIAGENDVFGEPTYSPEHEVSAQELAEAVDLDKVHGELLPNWLAALSYDEAGVPSKRSVERFEALAQAVEADANLHDIVVELGELMHSKEATEQADRILYLTFAWNDYLRQKDQPYHFEANMVRRQQGPMLYTKNYGLDAEIEFGLDDDRYTGLLASRIDSTNVVENYLCRATKDGDRPMWIVDTSASEATEHVWPMLASTNDATLEPVQRGFAEAIRKEAKGVLSNEAFAILKETAPLRHQMLEAVEAINARECNDFRFSFKPLIAYDSGRLVRLQSRAQSLEHHSCPPITPEELRTIIDTSDTLTIARRDAGLEDALGELTAWIARPRLVHEVRHRADEERHMARTLPMSCPGCQERLPADTAAELSGYLAGVAYTNAPVAGLFRACWVHATTRTYHADAIEPLVSELTSGQTCENGPVKDVQKKAAKADVVLFDRDEPIDVIGDWPKSVEVNLQ